MKAFSRNLLTIVYLQEHEHGTRRKVFMTCLYLLLVMIASLMARRRVKLSSYESGRQKSDIRLNGLTLRTSSEGG